jgi:hypothetical protein
MTTTKMMAHRRRVLTVELKLFYLGDSYSFDPGDPDPSLRSNPSSLADRDAWDPGDLASVAEKGQTRSSLSWYVSIDEEFFDSALPLPAERLDPISRTPITNRDPFAGP